MFNSVTRFESETDAHSTWTREHLLRPELDSLEDRSTSCASQRSGSTARTKPDGPERAAAQKLNKPTLAPMSHTETPGLTNSSTMLYRVGSTRDIASQ